MATTGCAYARVCVCVCFDGCGGSLLDVFTHVLGSDHLNGVVGEDLGFMVGMTLQL